MTSAGRADATAGSPVSTAKRPTIPCKFSFIYALGQAEPQPIRHPRLLRRHARRHGRRLHHPPHVRRRHSASVYTELEHEQWQQARLSDECLDSNEIMHQNHVDCLGLPSCRRNNSSPNPPSTALAPSCTSSPLSRDAISSSPIPLEPPARAPRIDSFSKPCSYVR